MISNDGPLYYEYSLHTPNFIIQSEDTVHNLQMIRPLIPAPGSDQENLVPSEALILIIKNYKEYVYKEMKWMFVGAIFFT